MSRAKQDLLLSTVTDEANYKFLHNFWRIGVGLIGYMAALLYGKCLAPEPAAPASCHPGD